MSALWGFITTDEFRNFVVILGVLVAMGSIIVAWCIAKRKQAADILFLSRGDKRLQEASKLVLSFHNSNNRNIRTLAFADRETDEASDVRYLLNHFELVSTGIQRGIYDEQMIKQSWCSIVVELYDQTLPFIKASRERAKKKTLYQEFQWLGKRWKKNMLKAKKVVEED